MTEKGQGKTTSKIAGEINAEMMKKAIHDSRAKLFAELVGKTGSQQSVIDCAVQEIESLRKQLAAMTADRDRLLDVMGEIAGSKSLTATPTQFYQHLQRIASDATIINPEALAATDDLGGLILCEKEPVAEVKKHTGSLKDMAIIVWSGEQPAEGTQLYRAWEPKP